MGISSRRSLGSLKKKHEEATPSDEDISSTDENEVETEPEEDV